jgi:hypothetical protein
MSKEHEFVDQFWRGDGTGYYAECSCGEEINIGESNHSAPDRPERLNELHNLEREITPEEEKEYQQLWRAHYEACQAAYAADARELGARLRKAIEDHGVMVQASALQSA